MKRLLSMALTLALILSLVPAAFAADEDPTSTLSGITVKYDFIKFKTMGTSNNDTVSTVDYADTYGFWNYRKYLNNRDVTCRITSSGGNFIQFSVNNDINDSNNGTNVKDDDFFTAIEIDVPVSGLYDVTLTNVQHSVSGGKAKLFIIPGSVANNQLAAYMKDTNNQNFGEEFSFVDTTINHNNKFNEHEETLGKKYFEKGKHIFVYAITNLEKGSNIYVKGITLDGTPEGGEAKYVPMISDLTATETDGVTTVNATATYMSDAVTSAADADITYSADAEDARLASVNEETGVVTGLANGTATIIATATKEGLSSSKSIEVAVTAPEDQDITDAFETETPTSIEYNPTVSGVGYNASERETTVEGITATLQTEGDYKDSYKMYAPKTNGDAQFLYWAKGLSANKKIVSYENEFYYTPAGGDNNILIAVYDNTDSDANKAEFYNANGQLIKLITDTSEDKEVPALPSMAGYNTASSWKQYNGDTEVTAGNEITPTGTMIFVAQYEREEPINVTVTVENGNGTATVPYGEAVTCTPDASKGTFKWWTKKVNGVSEIVSIDEEYSFRAYENCTVTAEYADAKPTYTGNKMKIIIDTFDAGNEKAVMAEFIGFGTDTVEKGIMYNGTKIAMTRPGNQFTVTGEAGDVFKGYAIVKDGDGYKLIVDGGVTISSAE